MTDLLSAHATPSFLERFFFIGEEERGKEKKKNQHYLDWQREGIGSK